MRRAAKKDDNQDEILAAARAVGAEVQSLHSVGGGVPDLLIAFRGVWYVTEIKDGSKPPSRRRLTHDEQEWHDRFARCAPVHVIESVGDLLRILGVSDG